MLSLHVCFRYQSLCAKRRKEFMKISSIFIILSPTPKCTFVFFSLIFPVLFWKRKRYCIAAQHIPLRMLQKQIHFLCNNFLWKSQRHRLMTTIHQHQIYIQKNFTEEGRLRHFFAFSFHSPFSRSSKNYFRSTSNSKIKIPEQWTTLIEFFIASSCAKRFFLLSFSSCSHFNIIRTHNRHRCDERVGKNFHVTLYINGANRLNVKE